MKFTLRDLLNALFRYSRALILLWAIILIAALVFYSQTKRVYDSKAKILITLGTEALGKAEYLKGENMMLLQRDQQIHNEQQILESHEVMVTAAKWILGNPAEGQAAPVQDSQLQEARRFLTGQAPEATVLLRLTSWVGGLFGTQPATASDKLEAVARELSNDLSVKPIFDSDALDVSFSYRNAEVAQTALKLVIAAYLEHHIAVFQSKSEADLLKAQLDASVGKYNGQLSELSTFMNAHRVYNEDTQLSVMIEQREKIKQALNETIEDGDAAAARRASLKSIDDSLHQFERYSTIESRNKIREALLGKLDESIVDERALLTRHPKGSRAYQDEEAKLDEVRRLLNEEPVQVVQETEQRRTKASEFVESEIINVTETQRGDQARTERLRDDLRRKDSEIEKYAKDLKDFSALKLELGFAKQESEQLAQVYSNSRLKSLTSQSSITDVSIIDAPTFDGTAASPNRKLVAAATMLLLLAGSLAVLFASIALDPTVADSSTAELRLGAPVVATLPAVHGEAIGEDLPDMLTRGNRPEFARMHRSVNDLGPGGKIILMAESSAHEGASLVGYSLATFLSRYAHEKTAFVDYTGHAMAEVTTTNSADKDRPTVFAWPGEQSGANSALSMLEKLRADFSYIVIAGGAAKDATDLLAISGLVSATFFVVEAGKTRRAAARYALDLLHRYGFKSTSLILNKRIFYIPGWLMRFV